MSAEESGAGRLAHHSASPARRRRGRQSGSRSASAATRAAREVRTCSRRAAVTSWCRSGHGQRGTLEQRGAEVQAEPGQTRAPTRSAGAAASRSAARPSRPCCRAPDAHRVRGVRAERRGHAHVVVRPSRPASRRPPLPRGAVQRVRDAGPRCSSSIRAPVRLWKSGIRYASRGETWRTAARMPSTFQPVSSTPTPAMRAGAAQGGDRVQVGQALQHQSPPRRRRAVQVGKSRVTTICSGGVGRPRSSAAAGRPLPGGRASRR